MTDDPRIAPPEDDDELEPAVMPHEADEPTEDDGSSPEDDDA